MNLKTISYINYNKSVRVLDVINELIIETSVFIANRIRLENFPSKVIAKKLNVKSSSL